MTSLNELRAGIKSCDACTLKDMPHVLWRGNIHAPLMVVGEAPGKWEHKLGKPWCGPAGKELDKAFATLDIDTDRHCFITNVVKARPVSTTRGKENDTPRVQQIKTCSDLWIKQEIALLKPKVILCLGKSAAVGLGILKPSTPMREVNGFEGWYDEDRESKVLITYHTASVLHMKSDKRYTSADVINRKREILNVLTRAKELAYPST